MTKKKETVQKETVKKETKATQPKMETPNNDLPRTKAEADKVDREAMIANTKKRKAELMSVVRALVKEVMEEQARPYAEAAVDKLLKPIQSDLKKEALTAQVVTKKSLEIEKSMQIGYADYQRKMESAARRIEASVKAAEALKVDEVGIKLRKLAERLQVSILRESVASEVLWWSKKSNPGNPEFTLSLMANLYEVGTWEDVWWVERKNLLLADWVKLLSVNFDVEISAYERGRHAGDYSVDPSEYAGAGEDDDVDEVGEVVQEVVSSKPVVVRLRSRKAREEAGLPPLKRTIHVKD